MRLLLDTHIWIWIADAPQRLGKRTSAMLIDPGNELWLSPISIWEFLTLAAKGRFPSLREPRAWLDRALNEWPLRDAPLSREIALETGRFELPHQDQADRLLVATARVLGASLVTADAQIIASGAVAVVPND